jgi:Peptidase A4 family
VAGWVVPTVSRPDWPQGTDGGWSSATWIGLGGAPKPGSVPPLPDVVAVGITQDVDSDGEASYGAWAEWLYELEAGGKSAQRTQSGPGSGSPGGYLPSPLAMSIGGFDIAPGDAIYAQIVFYLWSDPDDPMVGTVYAVVYLANGSNGQQAGLMLGMPGPASELCNTAQWIMDCPGRGFPASSLPAFTPVNFAFGFACPGTPEDRGPDAVLLGPGSPGAQTYNITQNGKRLRSVTTATTFPLLQISYTG